MIRRSIAGLILGPSLLIGSLAWSGSLALRTVFDADRSRDVAEELLDNDEVRSQLTENLGSAIEAVNQGTYGISFFQKLHCGYSTSFPDCGCDKYFRFHNVFFI